MKGALRIDFRHAGRHAARTPALSIAIILTLALGIGASSAVFAVVHALLLRPLPYPDADRLLTIWSHNPANTFSGSRGLGGERPEPLTAVSPVFLRDLEPQLRAMARVGGLSPSWPVSLSGHGAPEVVDAAYVTSSLLATLGLHPRIGRDFIAAEDQRGGARVAILSDRLWRSRFTNRQSIADAAITVNGERHAVVGVMPPGSSLPNTSAEILLPFALNPFAERADIPVTFVIGRLRPGATSVDAEREIDRVGRRMEAQLRLLRGDRLVVVPLRQRIAAGGRHIVLVLFAAVALLTIVGCANVSNLLLSRHAVRSHEIATRAALGAGRARLVRELLIESAVLGLMGCMVGLLVAWWLVGYLRVWLGSSLPAGIEISIDPGVVAFSFAASLIATLLFGTAPAWRASRQDIVVALRGNQRTVAGGEARLRALLIGSQVAMALVLVCGAALLARSLGALSAVDPGFRVENIATGGIAFPPARYPQAAARAAFVRALEARLASAAGIVSVGSVNRLPLGGAANNLVPVDAEGFAPAAGQPHVVDRRVATPRYFSTIDLPLVRGRLFTAHDEAGTPRVAIVNLSMARAVWGRSDPIGRRVRIGFGERGGPWLRVIGVVGDLRHAGLDTAPRPELYVPYAQSPVESMVVVVRSRGPAAPLVETLRKTIWALDPELPISDPATMSDVVARSLSAPRSRTALLSTIAFVALLLSAIGVASVAAHAASRMRRDLGIRMALGATRRDARRLVARVVLVPVAGGAAAGAALSVAAARSLQAFLFHITPDDPVTLIVAVVVVAFSAWVAATIPAWRASRANPMNVLRE